MTTNTAIVTGATGQDGSYLCEFLLDKGYDVVGLKRRSSTNNTKNLSLCLSQKNFILEEYEVTDPVATSGIISNYKPSIFFNCCAQSNVATSFSQPSYTFNVNAVGVLNQLEAIRLLSPETRYLTCSTSEMFGSNYEMVNGVKMQTLNTPLQGNSPYGVAKIAAHNLCGLYRKSYNIFAATTICYNHSGCRRGEEFIERKITKYVASLYKAKKNNEKIGPLRLGNIESYRDFLHSKDCIRAMFLALQQNQPDSYIVCSGKTWQIKEICELAFKYIGEDYQNHIIIDEQFKRPCDVPYLLGDNSKTKEKLGWRQTILFEDMLYEMIENDISELE